MRQAVILAGGMGTRLGTLTAETPKPLLKVGGKPFLDYLTEHLARHGAEHLILMAGPHERAFRDYAAERTGLPVDIDVVADVPAAGTGGALSYAFDLLDDRFLLLNGDSYFDFNLLDLATNADAGGSLARIALRYIGDTSRYGRTELDGERITAFSEKSSAGGGLINGGVYWLSKSIFANPLKSPMSIEADVFPDLARAGWLSGVAYEGASIDIGIPEDFARAQSLLPSWRRRPAAFLDRDGIVNHDTGYVWRKEDYKWMEGIGPAIKRLNDLGYYVFIVTNQAGVARGLYRTEDIERLHRHVNETLKRQGAHIDAFYYCPHHPDFGHNEYRRNCTCRKPGPGMLQQAMRDWPVDLSRSFMIGDKDTDIQAGIAAGVPKQRLFLDGDIAQALEEIAPPWRE
jgi:D,D-heptose 1,7-bisphosphate phosphatase